MDFCCLCVFFIGIAIQWGSIGDVGVIQETMGSDVVIGGTIPQRITSCLTVLDKFLQQNNPVVSSYMPYQQLESSTHKASKHTVLPTVANIFGNICIFTFLFNFNIKWL